MATMTSPLRPTTLADTLYPLVLQVATAVSAIVSAMAAEISLWATKWAFAEPAKLQAMAAASEIPAKIPGVCNAVLDMGCSPETTLRRWRAIEKSFRLCWMDRFGRRSLQVGGHLFDAGLGTSLVLIAARRTGHADRTDRLIADLARQRALRRNNVGEPERTRERIARDAVGKFTGRPCKGARRVGLLHGVLERNEAGAVVAHTEHHLALAAQYVHGHVISLRLAGIHCDPRNRGRHGERDVLVGEELGIRRAGKATGERRSNRNTGNTERDLGHGYATSLVSAAAAAAYSR